MRESYFHRLQTKTTSPSGELFVFAAILLACNLPLAGDRVAESMVFMPDRVMAGEWWRILSHPFVHITWYHLLLDAGAFLLLYGGIGEPSRLKRVAYVAICGMGSLGVSMLASPVVHERGLCGLSGIAHGLMAVSALELAAKDSLAGRSCRAGMITFGIVVAKSVMEVLSGHVLFESLHFGMMGLPIPESHAGGVLSGIAAFLVLHSSSRSKRGRALLNRHMESARCQNPIPHPGHGKRKLAAPWNSIGSTQSRWSL